MSGLGHILKQTFPRRLIWLRERQSLTQKALAGRAGIAPSTVNEIESGLASDVMLSTVILLGASLAVSPDFLLGLDCPQDAAIVCARESLNLGAAIIDLANQGNSEAMLATQFGLTQAAIGKILEEEYEVRRRRRMH
jgi:transcriptional regulator with XRE-family HTH domain